MLRTAPVPLALRRLAAAARRFPLDAALALVVLGAAAYVLVAPFAACHYPPMTDLPFHGTQTSALRHYADPAWHLREQFRLQPLAVPYLSMYVIGALFMLVLPPVVATKAAAAVMLSLLPAGLAVLFRGMKRSPLLGVLGLGVVWCNLTHWGFINFMGALGLFAMAVGLALMLVDRPTPGRQLALALTLLALFATHIFRYPFALCGVVGAAIVVYPATRRIGPVVLPILPSLALFLAWTRVRTDAQSVDLDRLVLHWDRLSEVPGYLFASFTDPAEQAAVTRAGRILLVALAAAAVGRLLDVQHAQPELSRRRTLFTLGAAAVPLACAAVFLGMYLWLPMQMGLWWYVYPREITAVLFLGLGAFPDLPSVRWLRASIVVSLAAAAVGIAAVVVDNYGRFDPLTRDFHAITREIPQAPKLLYLIFDHRGSTRSNTPWVHLPAWVQAERGGWLSFHFAHFNASPIAYRDRSEPGAVVPPPVPLRWEWMPHLFNVEKHGAFFDWFLVRSSASPDHIFRADPTIERVDHKGTWWLYRRRMP